MRPAFTVGVVNYINTSQMMIPWRRLGGPEGWSVLESVPTVLNDLLLRGEIHAGLISSFAYGRNWRDYLLLPQLGISATGPVRSVVLLRRCPFHRLRRVVTTPHSATSVNLLRIILEERLPGQVGLSTGGVEEFEAGGGATGYLAIGDEALRLAGRNDLEADDLAELWLEETGLPFVFAVWAVRREVWEDHPGAVLRLLSHILQCRDHGAAILEEIARAVAPRIPMEPRCCLDYLHGIELDLGAAKRKGLEEFFRRLHGMGIYGELPLLRFVEEV